jgi:hypothetical protein
MPRIPALPSRRLVAILLSVAATAGCGKPPEPGTRLSSPARDTLERAKALDDTVRQQAEEQRRKIEASEK